MPRLLHHISVRYLVNAFTTAFLHKPPRQMHTLTGRLLFAHRYPRGRRANSGVFSIPGSAGAGAGVQNCAESPDSEPNASRAAHFLQDAAHGACLSPKIQYAGTLGC